MTRMEIEAGTDSKEYRTIVLPVLISCSRSNYADHSQRIDIYNLRTPVIENGKNSDPLPIYSENN